MFDYFSVFCFFFLWLVADLVTVADSCVPASEVEVWDGFDLVVFEELDVFVVGDEILDVRCECVVVSVEHPVISYDLPAFHILFDNSVVERGAPLAVMTAGFAVHADYGFAVDFACVTAVVFEGLSRKRGSSWKGCWGYFGFLVLGSDRGRRRRRGSR